MDIAAEAEPGSALYSSFREIEETCDEEGRDHANWDGVLVTAAALAAVACYRCGAPGGTPPRRRRQTMPKKFLDDVNGTLLKLGVAGSQAGWVAQNFITDDTEALDARGTQQLADATREVREGVDALRQGAAAGRPAASARSAEGVAGAGDAGRSERSRRSHAARVPHARHLRQRQMVSRPGEARSMPQHRRGHQGARDVRETKRNCAASGKAGTRFRRR